jgi:hypothetical protein
MHWPNDVTPLSETMKGGGLETIEAIRYAIELGMTHLTSSLLGWGGLGYIPSFLRV